LLPLTPHTVHPAFEDGTDTGFQNVGQLQFDAGEMPRRKYTKCYLWIQGLVIKVLCLLECKITLI